jgi:hypothetical protein
MTLKLPSGAILAANLVGCCHNNRRCNRGAVHNVRNRHI